MKAEIATITWPQIGTSEMIFGFAIEIDLPPYEKSSRGLELRYENPTSPADLGMSSDGRKLSIGLIEAERTLGACDS